MYVVPPPHAACMYGEHVNPGKTKTLKREHNLDQKTCQNREAEMV